MRNKKPTCQIHQSYIDQGEMSAPNSGKRWTDLEPSLSDCCLKGIEELGFEFMTPVQASTIPYFMQNKDVAVEAVTGSGKTLAFVIPVVEMLIKRTSPWSKGEVGALVISPTRELASQIAYVFGPFLPPSLSLALLIGGRDIVSDVSSVNEQGAQVIIATPGRLVDLLCRSDCQLALAVRSLEVLILDEADRLLELGFEQSINTVFSYLPKQRRTGLFSATLTQDVKCLIRAGMRNPVTITVKERQSSTHGELTPTPNTLHNYYLVSTPEAKIAKLFTLLGQLHDKKIIVFFATCASVSYFAVLTKRLLPSVTVLALHGRMHSKRQKCFDAFSSSSNAVLMCTDVMARGVDFPLVDWVVQFDPPSSTKAFVHRCGRTARIGHTGQAVVMLLESEVSYVDFLKLNQHISLEHFELASEGEGSDGDTVKRVRELAVKERQVVHLRDVVARAYRGAEIFEQGKRAFVSFVHFYYKHECKLIFQAKGLDLVGLGHGYGLPHLPSMPELKDKDLSKFTPHTIPPSRIPYRDKAREKKRKLLLQQPVQSEKTQRHLGTVKSKRKRLASKPLPSAKRKRKRHREEFSEAELDELAKEARLLKKFKAGKISKKQLEAAIDADI